MCCKDKEELALVNGGKGGGGISTFYDPLYVDTSDGNPYDSSIHPIPAARQIVTTAVVAAAS
jgi:hypothetical protein